MARSMLIPIYQCLVTDTKNWPRNAHSCSENCQGRFASVFIANFDQSSYKDYNL